MSLFELLSASAEAIRADESGAGLAGLHGTIPGLASDAAFASLTIANEADFTWVGVDPATGKLVLAADRATALAGFRGVQRRLSSGLAVVALNNDVLVNGLPALELSVLSSGDTVILAPGTEIAYVAERITPYIGRPTAEMIDKKQKCPFCRIPFSESDSRVITCHVGRVPLGQSETHPDTPADDRLSCFPKVKTCLSCSRPLTTEESLTFDPATL